jgi:hypothetical protein
VLCLLVFLLRIPTFAEPYWYGDEAIYLTIGNALRHGERLYLDIVDHKTPIIYYLAMVPSQTSFRMLALGASVLNAVAFWYIARKCIKRPFVQWGATLLVVLGLNLPALEGNIPNGEMFVLSWILPALALFWHTRQGNALAGFHLEKSRQLTSRIWVFVSGGLLSLGVLTKVPAVFDVAAVLMAFVLFFFSSDQAAHVQACLSGKVAKEWKTQLSVLLKLLAGLLVPILLSILYFWLRGSGQAYLDFGLLYNFRYAGNWHLPFSQPWLVWLFSLSGKTLLIGSVLLSLVYAYRREKISFALAWSASWALLTIFAATLSNRPYPHYFQQMVPSVFLTLAVWSDGLWQRLKRPMTKKTFFVMLPASLTMAIVGGLTVAVVSLLQVPRYPTLSYYQKFAQAVSGQISWQTYRKSFDATMEDNYKAAKIITSDTHPYVFIWGTNPLLYALTQKQPTGRFTVLFHIKDFQAEAETITSLREKKPTYAVTMLEETIPPELFTLLRADYIPNAQFDHFILWRRYGKDGPHRL